ncbi:IclR family transcriptional regulator [Comamonas thiooxydans]|jgi:IclR family acetate operon transcriptional repressor|uniref:IclR family transcriptional regulator n=1 Tax=Comamonas thiooxydans TaxID=363952 RepID=UPI00050EE5CA|nr:IclR family transcriptional regulator [Comamonas thiooxydans]KGH21304.1 hypothetical protein P606_18620 [Comamonas thiooxydans]
MSVPAAHRVLDLIELFAKRRRPMSLTAISRELKLPSSSCHGLIRTLEERGYLVNLKDQGGYYLTKRLKHDVDLIFTFNPLPTWILPALENIRDVADETVLLARMVGTNAVYVEVFESLQSIRYIAQVGDLRPLHASAAGKALLGARDAASREVLLGQLQLERRNPNTIVDVERLQRDLAESRERGWYSTLGEFLPDVSAIAVPIQVSNEIYSVVIAGPSERMRQRWDVHVQLMQGLLQRAELNHDAS